MGISNSVIIQWINILASSTGSTLIDLPLSFTTTNYAVSKIVISTSTNISSGDSVGTGYVTIYKDLSCIYMRCSNGHKYASILIGY